MQLLKRRINMYAIADNINQFDSLLKQLCPKLPNSQKKSIKKSLKGFLGKKIKVEKWMNSTKWFIDEKRLIWNKSWLKFIEVN